MFCRESGSWRIIKQIIKPCEILEIVQAAGFVSKSCDRKVFCRECGSWRIIKQIIKPCEILEIVQAAGFVSKYL